MNKFPESFTVSFRSTGQLTIKSVNWTTFSKWWRHLLVCVSVHEPRFEAWAWRGSYFILLHGFMWGNIKWYQCTLPAKKCKKHPPQDWNSRWLLQKKLALNNRHKTTITAGMVTMDTRVFKLQNWWSWKSKPIGKILSKKIYSSKSNFKILFC